MSPTADQQDAAWKDLPPPPPGVPDQSPTWVRRPRSGPAGRSRPGRDPFGHPAPRRANLVAPILLTFVGVAILAAAALGVLQHRETVTSGARTPEPATAVPSVPSPAPPTEDERGEDAPFTLVQRGKAPGNVPGHWSWVRASDGSFRVISGGTPFLEQIPGGWAVDFSIQRGRVAIYIVPTDDVDRPVRYTRQAHRTWLEGISGLRDVVMNGQVIMRGVEAWEATARLDGRTVIMRTLWSDGRLYHLRAAFYDQGDARRLAKLVLSSFTVR